MIRRLSEGNDRCAGVRVSPGVVEAVLAASDVGAGSIDGCDVAKGRYETGKGNSTVLASSTEAATGSVGVAFTSVAATGADDDKLDEGGGSMRWPEQRAEERGVRLCDDTAAMHGSAQRGRVCGALRHLSRAPLAHAAPPPRPPSHVRLTTYVTFRCRALSRLRRGELRHRIVASAPRICSPAPALQCHRAAAA